MKFHINECEIETFTVDDDLIGFRPVSKPTIIFETQTTSFDIDAIAEQCGHAMASEMSNVIYASLLAELSNINPCQNI